MLDTVLSGALKLPERERAELIAHLLESLEDSEDALSPEVWERVWGRAVQQRLAELDAGNATSVPAGEVFARVEASIGLAQD